MQHPEDFTRIPLYYTINTLKVMTKESNEKLKYPSYASYDLKIYLQGVFHYISLYIKDGCVIVPRNLEYATDPKWDKYLSCNGLNDNDWKLCQKFFKEEGYDIANKESHLIIAWAGK